MAVFKRNTILSFSPITREEPSPAMSSRLRHRRPGPSPADERDSPSLTAGDRSPGPDEVMDGSGEQRRLLDDELQPAPEEAPGPQSWALRNQWVLLAVASGACAAFNGVFAKLYVF